MQSYDVTSAGISAAEDRQKRIRIYFIMMSIRMACVASLLFVRGWWILVAAIGGILLPYLAVIIANEPDNNAHKRPEPIEPLALSGASAGHETSTVIIVDANGERRAYSKYDASENVGLAPLDASDTSGNELQENGLQH